MATVFLFAALAAATSRAEPPASSLQTEIAWARATWPDELEGLNFQAPLRKLLAWLPDGRPMTAYLFTEDLACRRATLSRRPRDEDAGEGIAPGLVVRVSDRPQLDSGERVRDVTLVGAGVLLSRDDGYIREAQGPDGRWREEGGGSGFGPVVYGALSYVNDRVARWDGEAMDLHAYCGGPVEWLSCPAGGERPCVRCDQIDVLPVQIGGLGGHGISHGDRPVTCRAACPTYPESPDMARIEALVSRVQLWQPRHAHVSQVPSLYKSRDDCLRDHPAAR